MEKIHREVIDLLSKHSIEVDKNKALASDMVDLIHKYHIRHDLDLNVLRAKIFTQKSMKRGRKCDVCDQNIKMYWKKVDSMMAYCLIRLYRLKIAKGENKYFHVEKDIQVPLKVGGSWAKLRYWGLIEEKTKDENNTTSRTSGYWRITQAGEMFVENLTTIPMYVKLYNGISYGLEGESINIKQCLNSKFNYEELLNSPLQ